MAKVTLQPVLVPPMGDFADVLVGEILVQPGDSIHEGQTLMVLESDKATVDVPATMAGVIAEVCVEVGNRVSEGTRILMLSRGTEASADDTTHQSADEAVELAPAAAVTQPHVAASGSPARTSPSVRALARKLGVDLLGVTPSGLGGRVLKSDVEAAATPKEAAKSSLLPGAVAPAEAGTDGAAADAFARFGAVEVRRRSGVQRAAAAQLQMSWSTIPHVTSFEEADITDLEALRSRINQGRTDAAQATITLTAFITRATAVVLTEEPEFNASLIGDHLCIKRFYNIGIAVDTPIGLVVPVIRNVDQMGIAQIADVLSAITRRARAGELKPGEFEGRTFTISSLGGRPGTGFTPIINHPDIAVLGVSTSRTSPIWAGSGFEPRLTLPLALSWDHRAVDGVAASRFLGRLVRLLSDPGLMLL